MGFSVKYTFILLFLYGIAQPLQGQEKVELDALFDYSSTILGTSSFLVNGWKYYPDHFNAAGNPYFNDTAWRKGSLSSGKDTFENVFLLYNVQMDELVLSVTLNDGSPAFVMLNKDFISSFSIGNHQFVNGETFISTPQLTGFIEMIYSGKFHFFIKHKKNFVGNFSADTPNGSFSRQSSVMYLLMDETLNKITSKKSLFVLFPEHKKEMNHFISQHNIRFKTAGNSQLEQLLEYCNGL
ncbi:MAG: hypothetical protein IH598_10650 [Bacteroidales bacterium]|nr:hypothetical protein [Bacteroidales bacterium]